MSLLPKPKTYVGKLELKGGSIAHHGKNAQHYATLLVNGYALHDVVVPERYEKLLQPGADIELTLCAASLSMFVLHLQQVSRSSPRTH